MELAKTSGKITTKPAVWAASAPRTVSATKAKIQLSASPKAATRAIEGKCAAHAPVEAEADDVADHDHQGDDQDVADQVRQRAAYQDSGARHRHRAEAVDHAALEVLREADGGLRRSEGHGLHEDPGKQEVHIGDAGGQ